MTKVKSQFFVAFTPQTIAQTQTAAGLDIDDKANGFASDLGNNGATFGTASG